MDDTTNPLNAAQKLADALLNAQVESLRSRLTGSQFIDLAATELDILLAQASEVLLGSVVNRQSIKDVVRVFAFELDLGGGVIALSGEMAQQFHITASNNAPKLKELFSNVVVSQWLDKILELQDFRSMVLNKIGESTTLHDFVSDHVLILIEQLIANRSPQWLQQLSAADSSDNSKDQKGVGTRITAGIRRKLNSTVRSQEEFLEKKLRQSISKTIQQSCAELGELDEDIWRDTIWQLWQAIRDESIAQFAEGLNPLDIEEFFVLSYDEWRRLRQTEYVQRLIYTGIDVFFDAYEQTPLTDLLDDVGVTRAHMLAEVTRFAPKVIQVLNESDYIQELLKRQLSPFYKSDAALEIISEAFGSVHQT
jgi:hypothetical protein